MTSWRMRSEVRFWPKAAIRVERSDVRSQVLSGHGQLTAPTSATDCRPADGARCGDTMPRIRIVMDFKFQALTAGSDLGFARDDLP
jgi:hypothetical protein